MSQLSFVDVFDMARESAGGCCVTQDAEAGTREQQQLTEVFGKYLDGFLISTFLTLRGEFRLYGWLQ